MSIFERAPGIVAGKPQLDFRAGLIPIADAAGFVGMDVETFRRHCASVSSIGNVVPIRPGETVDAADLYTYLFRRENAGKIPDNRRGYSLEEAAAITDIPIEILTNMANAKAVGVFEENGQWLVTRQWISNFVDKTGDFGRLLINPGYVPLEIREWRKARAFEEEKANKELAARRETAVGEAVSQFQTLMRSFPPEVVAEALAVLNRGKA